MTIEPGKSYQYRIKVRMANPNLGMPNVASPSYATDKKPLESADWFEIRPKSNGKSQPAVVPLVGGELLSLVGKQRTDRPQIVTVPPEYYLYTVDQQDIDNAEKRGGYTGQNAGVSKDRQAVFQIHKWLESTDENPTANALTIGEWSVAERVLAYRGEYIGRKQRVEIPYWRSQKEMFVLAVDTSVSGRRKNGLEIDFGPRIPDGVPPDPPYYSILVDFEGGPMMPAPASSARARTARMRSHASTTEMSAWKLWCCLRTASCWRTIRGPTSRTRNGLSASTTGASALRTSTT